MSIDIDKILSDVFGEDYKKEDEKAKLGSLNEVVQLYKHHKSRKEALGHRVQVLRKLVRVKHEKLRLTMSEWDFSHRCEAYLDNVLAKHKYKLDTIIEDFRKFMEKKPQ